VTDQTTALALPSSGGEMTSATILRGLHTVKNVLAPDLSDDELKLFAMVAARSGLDPFAKQVYAVKRGGRVTFQTGIDGYRAIAERTGQYDGQDEPEYGPECGCGREPKGHPQFATVKVYRKDMGRPIAATAYFDEYYAGDPGPMPKKMPRVMIAKVAEALALRKAFPYDSERRHGIGADLYTTEEMAQADRGASAAASPPLPTARQRTAARAAAVQAPVVAATDDGRAVDADGVIEGVVVDAGPALFEDEPPKVPTAQDIRDAADATGIDVVALAGRLFPAWVAADPRRPLNESERVSLMAEIVKGGPTA
jgi:phage recombination protein Bet